MIPPNGLANLCILPPLLFVANSSAAKDKDRARRSLVGVDEGGEVVAVERIEIIFESESDELDCVVAEIVNSWTRASVANEQPKDGRKCSY